MQVLGSTKVQNLRSEIRGMIIRVRRNHLASQKIIPNSFYEKCMYLVASRESSCGLICSLKEFSTKPLCIVIDVHCTCVPFYGQKSIIFISRIRTVSFFANCNLPYALTKHHCGSVSMTNVNKKGRGTLPGVTF